MSLHLERKIFSVWFGLGAVLYFFSIFVWLLPHSKEGAVVLFAAYILRIKDSFSKTCSRCPQYGSFGCGLPSRVVSFFYRFNKTKLDAKTIKRHAQIDALFIGVVGILYIYFLGFAGACALIWPVGAYFLVYKKKRFHGLLWQLESKT